MQISEKEERQDPEDGGGGDTEKSSGPWSKTAPVQAPLAPVIVTETPEPAMTSGVLTITRKTPQGPPEIYSNTQFPSLQSTTKHIESQKDKEMEKSFQVIRHKNRDRDEVSKNQALKLQLDNQYAVLENQKRSHSQYNEGIGFANPSETTRLLLTTTNSHSSSDLCWIYIHQCTSVDFMISPISLWKLKCHDCFMHIGFRGIFIVI
uniref:Uncharacterized protein n=1 Tax=Nomascus leucogenys TaxID=61853 RepID=A0A2I3GFG3_NOMLE